MKVYYKATDKDMKCRGVQFTLGEWSEPVYGELKECENGYHFCEHPSGVWAYYTDKDTRVFKIEIDEGDCIISTEAGADAKSVARKVRLIEEVFCTGNSNTGDYNTGDSNTGSLNTGDYNTGESNTGSGNTGDSNTGYSNTGNSNTGNRNTGNSNTGNSNTGSCNTGSSNTGYSNAGNRNTGDYNIGNRHTGVFGMGEAPFLSFGAPADMAQFDWTLAREFYQACSSGEKVDYSMYLGIANSTVENLEQWHKKLSEAKQQEV
jgi:hypothetical protein